MSTESATTDAASAEVPAEAAPASRSNWIVTIVIVSLLAWLAYSFPVKTWRIPESMSEIGALSPQADQDMKAAQEASDLWKNTLLKFGMAGLAFGLAGFIFYRDNLGKKLVAAIATLGWGIVAGLAAGALGLILRQYFNLDRPIPLISEASRPLFCDSVVFAVISALLVSPIAVMISFHGNKVERQKAPAVPFAGVLTGLLVPMTVGFIFATANTGVFPPASGKKPVIASSEEGAGAALTGGFTFGLVEVWFLTLCAITILLVVFSGARHAKNDTAAEA